MASVTATALKRVDSVATQVQPKITTPLEPPPGQSVHRAKASLQPNELPAQAEKASREPSEEPARPYLKLLMREPPPDQDCDIELRKMDCRYYFMTLSRGYANKDWRSRPVFDEEDDEDDEPLSPLLDAASEGVEVKEEDEGTKVVIDGEEMVDMIG